MLAFSVDAAIKTGEVTAERNNKVQKYCIASCNTPIDSAEVDRWRKLAAIPCEVREAYYVAGCSIAVGLRCV